MAGPAPRAGTCRCGAQLGPGTPSFQVTACPSVLAEHLAGVLFCSEECFRAHILESLAFFEGREDAQYRGVPEALRALLGVIGLIPPPFEITRHFG